MPLISSVYRYKKKIPAKPAPVLADLFNITGYTGNNSSQKVTTGIGINSYQPPVAPVPAKVGWWLTGIGAESVDYSTVLADGNSNDIWCITRLVDETFWNYCQRLSKVDGSVISSFRVDHQSSGNAPSPKMAVSPNAQAFYVTTDNGGVIKSDFSGNIAWKNRFTTPYLTALGVGAGPSDNAYVLLYDSASTPDQTLLAKFTPGGTLLWAKRISDGTKQVYGNAIAVSLSDFIYVVGQSSNDTGGTSTGFLIKYDSNGNVVWQRSLGTNSSSQHVFQVAVNNSNGDVFVTDRNVATILKYNSSGVLQWKKTLPGDTVLSGYQISADNAGAVHIAVVYQTKTSPYSSANAVIKYDTNGNFVWGRGVVKIDTYDGNDAMLGRPLGVIADSNQNVFVLGTVVYNTHYSFTALVSNGGAMISGVATVVDKEYYPVSFTEGSVTPFNLQEGPGSLTSSSDTLTTTGTTSTLSAYSVYQPHGSVDSVAATPGVPEIPETPGMVWLRSLTYGGIGHNALIDTKGGVGKYLYANGTGPQGSASLLTSFNSDGFNLGPTGFNANDIEFSAVTWKQAERFFAVVEWVGDGTANRSITHPLTVAPGMISARGVNNGDSWWTWHRSIYSDTPEGVGSFKYFVKLNSDEGRSHLGDVFGQQSAPAPSDTSFIVNDALNVAGFLYRAFLWAHDPSPSGVIQCGSFVTNSSGYMPPVLTGWEHQALVLKAVDTPAGDWLFGDSLHGMFADGEALVTSWNNPAAQTRVSFPSPNGRGFSISTPGQNNLQPNTRYIYMIVRRESKVPSLGTEVFQSALFTGNNATSRRSAAFPPDLVISHCNNGGSPVWASRAVGPGKYFKTDDLSLENSDNPNSLVSWDHHGVTVGNDNSLFNSLGNFTHHYFKRTAKVFDSITYSGDADAARILTHSLGIAPDLVIVMSRFSSARKSVWLLGNILTLNSSGAQAAVNSTYGRLAPNYAGDVTKELIVSSTDANGEVSDVNGAGNAFIAHVFATLPGVSKIGTYNGNGASLTIDCGFTTGARFFMVKNINQVGDWFVFDTVNGIVGADGKDPFFRMNTNTATDGSYSVVEPHSSGITVVNNAATAAPKINTLGASYAFVAFA